MAVLVTGLTTLPARIARGIVLPLVKKPWARTRTWAVSLVARVISRASVTVALVTLVIAMLLAIVMIAIAGGLRAR